MKPGSDLRQSTCTVSDVLPILAFNSKANLLQLPLRMKHSGGWTGFEGSSSTGCGFGGDDPVSKDYGFHHSDGSAGRERHPHYRRQPW
jgi:hypothetical protein